MESLPKLVCIDRDGVVNPDPHATRYVRNADQFELQEGVAVAIKILNDSGIQTALISNQAGIARGLMTETDLQDITDKMKSLLALEGAHFDRIYYCKDHPDQATHRRKPGTGMLDEAALDVGVRASEMLMIGDSEKDILAASNFGCRSILVLSGKTTQEGLNAFKSKPDQVCSNLREAVEWIVQQKY